MKISLPLKQSQLCVAARAPLAEWAMTPGSTPTRVETFSELLGISRTPLREALLALESVGLLEVRTHKDGIRSTFTGPSDIARRINQLAAAVECGPDPVGETAALRVAHSAGGTWAAIAWSVLTMWPQRAGEWNIDLASEADRIRDALGAVKAASTSGELAATIRAYGALVTN